MSQFRAACLVVTAVASFQQVLAQTIPALPAGTQVLSPTCSTVLNAGGLETAEGDSATVISVNDPAVPFTQALNFVNAKQKKYTYFTANFCDTVSKVEKDDLILATYWVRNASPDPKNNVVRIEFTFQLNRLPYTVDAYLNSPVDVGTWKKYVVPFRVQEADAAGNKSFQLRFGNAKQQFDIGGVSLVNYGNIAAPLPTALKEKFSFYYPGRNDPDAPWRKAALANIEATRKASMSIRVTKTDGSAAAGASIKIRQVSTPFNWGTSVQPSDIVGGPRATPGLKEWQLQRYRQAIINNFNNAGMQNELKWTDWEQDSDTPARALDWFQANGLRTRGHTLFWPGDEPFFLLPADIRDPGTPAVTLRTRSLDHVTAIMGQFKGRIPEWDVINEPYEKFYLQGLVDAPPFTTAENGRIGNAIAVDWFKKARAVDPAALLFLNDYNIFAVPDLPHRDYIVEYVKYLKNNGAPVDGIGFQSHFGATGPIFSDMTDAIAQFDPFVQHYSATEFDFTGLDETMQADVTNDYATFVFGSPKFNTLQVWGFWDGNQDVGNGLLFRKDWTLKPAGVVWQTLTKKLWRTNTAGTTNRGGNFNTRAFLGNYKITVTVCGKSTVYTRELTADAVLTFPAGC